MKRGLLLGGIALLLAQAAQGAPPAQTPPANGKWMTLGTMGGPIANAQRSQPANVLLTASGAVLVDVGDGAAEQLAKAGVPLPRVRISFRPR